ncbi:hypothetical protein, partial [Thalassospira xianhensis]|uniref:hypothetical protein n=1 Tax=Thalassospira xianhensis TaxID=478503 RepID=UPI001ABFDA3A
LSYGPSTLVKRVLMGLAAAVNTCFPYFPGFYVFWPQNAKAALTKDGFRLHYVAQGAYCASAATCIFTI